MRQKIQRALISVSDKSGVEGFARTLSQMGVEILSSGGTHAKLAAAGIAAREVSDYTGFPEMMDGRIKTLHPKVHGGILALRDVEAHLRAMEQHEILAIDLVVVNLYPFEQAISKKDVKRADAIEQIDIGGPTLVRAAAKNHRFTTVVTDPADYGRVLDDMQRFEGAVSEELARELAVKAFALTARYDAAISRWLFERQVADGETDAAHPAGFALAGTKVMDLRYGENPHQTAAFYRTSGFREPSVASAELLTGKALSYNNLVDLDAALSLAKEFDEPFVAVLKHNNPCGAAAAEEVSLALARAWDGDALSAFGSVLAFTRPVDLASAEFLTSGGRFVEAIVAPAFEDDAYELLTTKPKWGRSVRLLACGELNGVSRDARDVEVKKLVGGFLVQSRDLAAESARDCTIVTKKAPSAAQLDALVFAGKVGKHVKSNAIVLARDETVVGVGAGQMSRVDAVLLACRKAGARARGSVLASDAFFPFADGVEAAIAAGVEAILQPGGSVRDDEVIAACDRLGAAMVFTGTRHFRH